MSVLIKDMEMPTTCNGCPMCRREETQMFPRYLCTAAGRYTEDGIMGARQPWCPIVEVPGKPEYDRDLLEEAGMD